MVDNTQLIFIFVIILFLWYTCGGFEQFSYDTTTFIPQGYQRHGLRSDPLHPIPRSAYFIRPDRHIRLNQTGNMMFESNNPPTGPNCRQVKCPCGVDEYDSTDKCWRCD